MSILCLSLKSCNDSLELSKLNMFLWLVLKAHHKILPGSLCNISSSPLKTQDYSKLSLPHLFPAYSLLFLCSCCCLSVISAPLHLWIFFSSFTGAMWYISMKLFCISSRSLCCIILWGPNHCPSGASWQWGNNGATGDRRFPVTLWPHIWPFLAVLPL